MKFAFSKSLAELAEKDPRIALLVADLGFGLFDDFERRFGPRYINVGVAEAQMVCAAAGLAHVGWKPVTYSIASFATARCFEQIKISVAYPGLPVVIVGAGGGYAYGRSGVTHHSGDDIGLMRSLPGMTVVAPGNSEEMSQLLPQVLEIKGPAYLRIGRGKEPHYNSREPAVLGKARLLSDGGNIAVISTGEVACEVAQAIEILSRKKIFPIAYQFHTVKPLDIETLEKLVKQVKTIVVVEEHIGIGGLGCAVRDWACKSSNLKVNIKTLAVPDEFVLGSPSQMEVRSKYGIDAAGISKFIEENLLSG
jgi:transketolase